MSFQLVIILFKRKFPLGFPNLNLKYFHWTVQGEGILLESTFTWRYFSMPPTEHNMIEFSSCGGIFVF